MAGLFPLMIDLLSSITIQAVLCGWILAAFSNIAYQIIYYRFFHPLAKFPGPFFASVTRLWFAYHVYRGNAHTVGYALHQTYGPVVRVTPTMLLVSDATRLPDLYHRQVDKSGFYVKGMLGKAENILNTRDWRQHSHLRKVSAGVYAFSNIKKMEPTFDSNISTWIHELKNRFAMTTLAFDFAPWGAFMAFDVMSDVAFGGSFGFCKSGQDVGGLIDGFHDGLPTMGTMSVLHPFTNWLRNSVLGSYAIPSPSDNNGWGRMMRFRDKMIKDRRIDVAQGKINRVDLLQTFIDARDDHGNPLGEETIKSEVLLVLMAGADTTSTALRSLIHLVLSHPNVHARIRQEIDNATSAGLLSAPAQWNEVNQHCPYYVACVKEALRVYPPAPVALPRLVREGGISLDNKFVPAGIEVASNAWTTNRDPNIYGADANDFRPERWLESPEKARDMEKYSLTFGYGARTCLGKDIAMMELLKAPLELFRKFDVEVVEDRGPAKFVVLGVAAMWENMWLKLSLREGEAVEG